MSSEKYTGVIFDCTAGWCKILRKFDLYFLKWYEEFGKFSPASVWKSKIWDLYWVLLSKVENVSAQNLHRSFASWEWRIVQNLMRTWLVNWKLIWWIWWILNQARENLKHLNFNELLWTKVVVVVVVVVCFIHKRIRFC